jgi:cytoskeletal protein CcmA (bactofilin family)
MITSSKKNPELAQTSNRILIGTEIKGNITSPGDFRIDGKLIGNIAIDGKLVIGEKGEVEGEISCSNVTIAGVLRGKAQVKELATLIQTAKFEGELYSGKLAVEAGAEFTGTCNMGAVLRNIKDDKKPKEQSA